MLAYACTLMTSTALKPASPVVHVALCCISQRRKFSRILAAAGTDVEGETITAFGSTDDVSPTVPKTVWQLSPVAVIVCTRPAMMQLASCAIRTSWLYEPSKE